MEKISLAAPVQKERDNPLRPVVDQLYAVLADLRHCQTAYGLKARHLTTLSVMMGFLKGQNHTMVFASNCTLQERLNNVSLRSLQRSLADLVASGMIERRSSPNGKRFALRYRGGRDAVAFGFDLGPLLRRASEISHLAESHRSEVAKAAVLKLRLRQALTSLATALPHHPRLPDLRCALRRKLIPSQLEVLLSDVKSILPNSTDNGAAEVQILESTSIAKKMTRSDSHFGMHHHKSDKEFKDLMGGEDQEDRDVGEGPLPSNDELINLVLTACPDVACFQTRPARSWPELRDQAPQLASWIGVSTSLLTGLYQRFGNDQAAIAIFCLVQASPNIRSPGAYLSSLVQGARSGSFNPMRWLRRFLIASNAGGARALHV